MAPESLRHLDACARVVSLTTPAYWMCAPGCPIGGTPLTAKLDNFESPDIDGPSLPDTLRAFALAAAVLSTEYLRIDREGVATDVLADGGQDALAWMRAAHEALKAASIAEAPMTDDERDEYARQAAQDAARVGAALEEVLAVERQRDALARRLSSLASEFESAGTTTAGRLARRIRDTLDRTFPGEAELKAAIERKASDPAPTTQRERP